MLVDVVHVVITECLPTLCPRPLLTIRAQRVDFSLITKDNALPIFLCPMFVLVGER